MSLNSVLKITLKRQMPRHSICSASLWADIKLALKTAWLSDSARCSPLLHWGTSWKIWHFSGLLMAGMDFPFSPVKKCSMDWAPTNLLFFLHVLQTKRRALEPASPLIVVCRLQRKLLSSNMNPCKASMWKRCYYFKRRWRLDKQKLQRRSAPAINCKRQLFLLALKLSISLIIIPQLFVLSPAALGRWCLEKGRKDRVRVCDPSLTEHSHCSTETEP